jgi:BMFP domain-containing protein YqiC
MRDLEVVTREEFEAVKEMAQLAREENEKLKARIQALELAAAARSDQPSEPGWTAPPSA